MKILFLSDNYHPEKNGASGRVTERAQYWAEWGHAVTIVTSAPNFPDGVVYPGYSNDWYVETQEAGVQVVRVKTYMAANKGTLLRILDFVSYMLMAIVGSCMHAIKHWTRPDVVVATSPQFFTAVAGYVVSVVLNRPFVFEVADLWPASIRAVGAMRSGFLLDVLEKLEIFLYKQAHHIVVLTPAFRDDLVYRGIDGRKITVITNGVDTRRFQPQPQNQTLAESLQLQDKFVIGYIGTVGMAHGLENVIQASRFLSAQSKVYFMLVGPGAEREQLIAMAREQKADRVIFVDQQPKDQIKHYWSLCQVALVHLKNEPVFATVLPSKMFEAMGMGLPVLLVAPEGQASQTLHEAQAGIAIASAQPELLAHTAERLCQDETLLKTLAQKSLQASYHYSRERQAQKMIDCLMSIQGRQL